MVDHDAVRATLALMVVTTMMIVAGRASSTDDVAPQSRPNFAEHIAPVLRAHCTVCHRPGRPVPFALVTYEETRAQGEPIVKAVESGHMPPAQPAIDQGLPPFRDVRRLDERQIRILRNWVATGMPPGDLRRIPPPPDYPIRWPLGVPDVTMSLPRAIPLPPGADPRVFNVVLGLASAQDRWIRAIDFSPTSQGAINHLIFFTVPGDHVIDDTDLLPGVPGLLSADRLESPGARLLAADRSLLPVAVWRPGALARVMPADTGHKLPAWHNLVMQIHTRPSDEGGIEDGQVGIYWTPSPPPIELRPIQVPPSFGVAAGLAIPAGESAYALRDSLTLPVAVDAYAARGLAHLRGRSLRLTAVLPNGRARNLLVLDRWDPGWPDTYFFAAPVRLPAGTRLESEIVYDNSPANARLAGLAMRRVAWGPTLASEVGTMTLIVSLRSAADLQALEAARAEHFKAQVLRR